MATGNPIEIDPEQLSVNVPRKLRKEVVLSQDTTNLVPYRGALAAREGWGPVYVLTDSIIGQMAFKSSAGQFLLISATTVSVFLSTSPYTGASINLKGSNSALTAANTQRAVFSPLLNSATPGFVMTNNTDPPIAWKVGDIQWTVLSAAPAKARCCATVTLGVAGNVVMLGNTTESLVNYPSRIRWSSLNDHTTWPAASYADLLATADSIVAIRAFNRLSVAIYKDSSIWVATAQPGTSAASFAFEIVDRTNGPIGPGAICDGPYNTHIYLGRDGILYRFDGSAAVPVARLSDLNGFSFDSAHTENNCILYDRYRSRFYGVAWALSSNTTISGLVSISSGSIAGLVQISSGTITGLVVVGNVCTGFVVMESSGKIFPVSFGTRQIRSLVNLADVAANNNAAGMDTAICVDQAVVDGSSTTLAIVSKLELPISPTEVYEFDGIEYLFDEYAGADVVTVTVFYGPDIDHTQQAVIWNAPVQAASSLLVRSVNLQGRYLAVQLSMSASSRIWIRKINLWAWGRRLYA